MRLLSERRRDLVRSRTQAVSRLHQVLMQLIPAGAPKKLTAAQARIQLAKVRPRDAAGNPLRRRVPNTRRRPGSSEPGRADGGDTHSQRG
jgi:hypothetical protein